MINSVQVTQFETETSVIIDVRSPSEFNESYLPGAINIPLDTIESKIKDIANMPKPILVYCLSGGRSGVATSILQQNGIAEAYNGGGVFTLNNILNNN